MIVVYPFSTVDQDLALKNAVWMRELGGCRGHQVLALYDKRCVPSIVDEIISELKQSFDEVHRLEAGAEIDGWPEGANYFFRLANSWLEQRYRNACYLWLEPDAIPMKAGWLDKLVAEYLASKRPFMGDRVQVENIPLHMSGVGFYPVPLHAYAGEAYRAAEIAWDMAGKDQIVPRAFFTKQIEHAWKHPKFTNHDELQTQIRPECLLFHSSKDGSLIDLLRGSSTKSGRQIADRSVVQVDGPAPNGLSGREVGATSLPPKPQSEVYAGSSPVQATTDIFIRTYPGDYKWLMHCLHSIQKFCTGFRKVWVVSTQALPFEFPIAMPFEVQSVEWKQMNDESEDGYLAQQITKLYADVITDYQPDNILHVDSDVLFTRPVTPQDFFDQDGNLIWYYTMYEAIRTPWQPITEKFMGMTVEYEFMRRLPMMIPRWLYPKLREFVHKRHGMPIADYIRNQPHRAFSEFNALGAYAYAYHHDKIRWRNTQEEGPMPPPFARQFHSWGGITPEVEKEIEAILHGADDLHNTGSPTPSQPVATVDSAPLQKVKVLPNGIWVIEGDQISKWVEQEGRLDHDQNLLPHILKHINPGDTVVDVGAFIGDHTIAYAQAVGPSGRVLAFEPNPVAFRCLGHNVHSAANVRIYNNGLSDLHEVVPLSANNGNSGGAYVGEHMPIGNVPMHPLDDEVREKVDFIKIDAEGYELHVLHGAEHIISAYKPTMVIEINKGALDRQGHTPGDIFRWLHRHGYDYSVMQDNCKVGDDLYDILCLSANAPPEKGETDPVVPLPLVSGLPISDQVKAHIACLKEICATSPQNKAVVMQQLVYAGLKQPNPKNKKKNAKKDAKKSLRKKEAIQSDERGS